MAEETSSGTFHQLLQAFLRQDQSALEKLAQQGVSVDLRDAHGHTVLLRAAALGEAAAVEWILQAGAEIDACAASETAPGGQTALLLAAEQGHLRTVETLLASGAKLNRVNEEGASALMLAAHRGHLETVRLLVRSGVDLDLKNHRGQSALFLAQFAGHGDIISLLQVLGAAGEAPRQSPAPNPASSQQFADVEWQTPSTPQTLRSRSPSAVASENLVDDSFSDDLEDRISDWIDDDSIDL